MKVLPAGGEVDEASAAVLGARILDSKGASARHFRLAIRVTLRATLRNSITVIGIFWNPIRSSLVDYLDYCRVVFGPKACSPRHQVIMQSCTGLNPEYLE